ncbi:hypothetical protein QA584_06495 [Anaerocolumna sp. AGMB13025]|uniref:hypothetical protein n=1 Tax=Anaerocolumna sp. AGMB13025 TaxID=3039116 RepID=UPI00241C5EDC|nr:hypothetical protein [Anaerocolumna sp. AGMB13025]WFR58722.1 hypothetical protein QA584_06495 [Anaerocolumna sp. AGMB13025]
MLKKSPSGSLCPYYYMGGELHPLKYGSFFKDKNRLFKIMEEEEAFILNAPGENNRRIWIDLYETTIDNEVIEKLAAHILRIQNKIFKVCFVGCGFFTKQKIRKAMAYIKLDLADQVRFFSDPETAKMWLVGKY